jgi:hypothetical protein
MTNAQSRHERMKRNEGHENMSCSCTTKQHTDHPVLSLKFVTLSPQVTKSIVIFQQQN